MPQYGGDAERGWGSSRESGERRAAWSLRSVLRRVFQSPCLLLSPVFDIPHQKENMELDNDTVRTRQQPAFYRVQREMWTEEHVQAFLERNLPSTFGGEPQIAEKKTQLRCRFSWESFKKIIYKRFPILSWLFSYQFREWILKDLHAGLNVGLVQVPQGLLGVWLAGLPLPTINGFLSAFCCSVLYVVFGSSHHISIGSFSILNLVVKNILKSLDLNKTLSFNSSLVNFSDPTLLKGYVETLALTASVTFMTGVIQELIAVGLCNICSSFFRSFAVSCAISGTVIQEKAGGRTQIAALMGASIMLVIALKLGHFFQMIPNSVLAAIVVFNMLPFLEKLLDIPTLWRKDKYHLAIWLGTFAAVLCLGLDIGLLIALAIAFFIISIRTHRMKMVELGQIPNTNIYRSLSICRAAMEIDGVKIFQCCSSISFANMNSFKNYLLHKMDMKTVPLNPNEIRALVSANLSDISVESKDFKCSCVCDPPLPPPRIPYTQKLVKSYHVDSNSTSSSVNLVRWSEYGVRQNCGMLLLGAANAQSASPGIKTQLQAGKNEDEGKQAGVSPSSAVGNTSAQLDQEEQPVHLPSPVHTIILDFSMVQFVDLQGSDLLRQIFHMFFNIGITVLIAGCHSSVIAAFEKNEFFDSCVTKEVFFLTLHDALLAALARHQKPDEIELTAEEHAEKLQAEDEMEINLLMEKNGGFFSARKPNSKLLREEPISDNSYSAQNAAESSSHLQFETLSLQLNF
ncbi:testis anion transporter 1 isoform X5 [Lagopus leucura]|uniref:testis anion transporter 1 isoform X5 n=1 Tax=Lagopus leucura TaxID=30410 RepID=UPI001C676F46|nr:testis anion transporter 1 isoform X5 [Lagopus leucura]